jgi:hypothetical protein
MGGCIQAIADWVFALIGAVVGYELRGWPGAIIGFCAMAVSFLDLRWGLLAGLLALGLHFILPHPWL